MLVDEKLSKDLNIKVKAWQIVIEKVRFNEEAKSYFRPMVLFHQSKYASTSIERTNIYFVIFDAKSGQFVCHE